MARSGSEVGPSSSRRTAIVVPRHTLVGVVRISGTDQRTYGDKLVHHPRHQGKLFTNLNSRNIRLDRRELAANLPRRIGFDVIHILMRRTTTAVNHDYRLMGSPDTGLRFQT